MIDTFYNPLYGAKTDSLSMRKLPLIAKGIEQQGLARLASPQRVSAIVGKLMRLHDPDYVSDFITGTGGYNSSGLGWSAAIREGVLWSNAGTLEAAEWALDAGVASSISQGFHHAHYDRGQAFCTFNGLALVAQELPDKKIFVLDCDEHQGNGTKEFAARQENLYTFSIFGSHFGNHDQLERAWDKQVSGWDAYESALWDALLKIAEVKPDLTIFQAGVDCFSDDCFGLARLSTQQLAERDRTVFQFLRDAGIPVMFVMAGGYGDKAVGHHIQTYQQAVAVFD